MEAKGHVTIVNAPEKSYKMRPENVRGMCLQKLVIGNFCELFQRNDETAMSQLEMWREDSGDMEYKATHSRNLTHEEEKQVGAESHDKSGRT